MHFVIGGSVHLDRQEGAGTDMQSQRFMPDSGSGQRGHQIGREMQCGGWCGHRAITRCEHGLVIPAIPIIGLALARDVRRERHSPRPLKQDFDGFLTLKTQCKRAIRMTFLSDCRSEEHTSELQSLMRISYAVFCLKKKNNITKS